jgi:hypothetical protein
LFWKWLLSCTKISFVIFFLVYDLLLLRISFQLHQLLDHMKKVYWCFTQTSRIYLQSCISPSFLCSLKLLLSCQSQIREAMGKILARGHSRVPVYSGNHKNVIGLLLVCIFPHFDFIYIISLLLGSFVLTCFLFLFIIR